MSYQAREAQAARDARWQQIKQGKLRAVSVVEGWLNDATALHGDSATATEKQELLAERADLIARLKVVLGV